MKVYLTLLGSIQPAGTSAVELAEPGTNLMSHDKTHSTHNLTCYICLYYSM